jgi:hypothetical protein
MNRRDLLKNGTLAGVASLLATGTSHAKTADTAAVIAGLSAYSLNVKQKAEGTRVHLLASIDHLAGFRCPDSRCKALPFDDIKADGNLLTFSCHGADYTLENVLPEHFDARAKTMGA